MRTTVLSLILVPLVLVTAACREEENFLKNETLPTPGSQALAGEVSFRFTYVSLFKSISVGSPQEEICRSLSTEYKTANGVNFDLERMSLSHTAPAKHCARRNEFKQCETTQYIYTFTCRVPTKSNNE